MVRVAADKRLNIAQVTYASSWIDRLTAWVDGFPGPAWSYYVGFGLALLVLQAAALWLEGASAPISYLLGPGYLAGAIAFLLVLFHYMDVLADDSLATLRPALKADQEEYLILRYQLTSLPARTTLLASLGTLGIVFLIEAITAPTRLAAPAAFSISSGFFRIIYLVSWWLFGAFLYHTVHQLRMIDHVYTRYTRVNLFQLKPLYAFSNLSALTAGSIVVLPYGWLLVNRIELLAEPVAMVLYVCITSLAVAAFIWPQLGIHRIEVAEKDRLVDEANQRLEATIARLHRQVDDGELEDISALNTVMSTLKSELGILDNIPTWPWRPETVRWLTTALLLPLGLWFIQLLLQRVLTP